MFYKKRKNCGFLEELLKTLEIKKTPTGIIIKSKISYGDRLEYGCLKKEAPTAKLLAFSFIRYILNMIQNCSLSILKKYRELMMEIGILL